MMSNKLHKTHFHKIILVQNRTTEGSRLRSADHWQTRSICSVRIQPTPTKRVSGLAAEKLLNECEDWHFLVTFTTADPVCAYQNQMQM